MMLTIRDSDHDTASVPDDSDADPDFIFGSKSGSVSEASSSDVEDIEEPVRDQRMKLLRLLWLDVTI